MGFREFRCHIGQLEVVDGPVHDAIGRDEGDNLHRVSTLWTDKRDDLVDLADHFGPAAAGDLRTLLLEDDQLSARLF